MKQVAPQDLFVSGENPLAPTKFIIADPRKIRPTDDVDEKYEDEESEEEDEDEVVETGGDLFD